MPDVVDMTAGTRAASHAAAVRAGGRFGRPLGTAHVRLRDGLLAQWQVRNQERTIPHVLREIVAAGNLENFRRIADGLDTPFRGRYPFLDTDVYKTLEGVVYEIARGTADPETLAFYEEAVDLIARAQAPDGYLGTRFQGADAPKAPWEDLAWGHELYNLGHLLQAAVAAARQLGDERLLVVARAFADLAVARFGPDGEPRYCGHPEVEMALVELYRETRDARYLELARVFVDRRGSGTLSHSIFPAGYFQDEVPLRELESVTGHAVRMVYLAAGATDVALETGDTTLLAHLEHLWDDMVATKSYLTGGIGSRHSDEAFGDRYELPSERAYAETCAAIGAMQWGWRLFLATGRADVLDHVERVLLNAYGVGLSLEGTAFFYDNPLQRRPDHDQRSGAESGGEDLRRAWFSCPCCPPNVVRWMSQLQDHLAVADEGSLTLATLAAARVDAPALDVEIETDYPWEGHVLVRVLRARDGEGTLRVRVPAWAVGARAVLDGEDVTSAVSEGWLVLTRRWSVGAELVLTLPMPVRAVAGHPHTDATRGAAALLRGPVVLSVEQGDVDVPVDDLVLVPDAVASAVPAAADRASRREHPLAAQVLRHGVHTRLAVAAPAPTEPFPAWPARSTQAGEPTDERLDVVLVPYAWWGNRGTGAMRVWLRTS